MEADVLPGEDGVEVEIEPPNQQQGEVERAEASGALIVLEVGLQGESRHHGYKVKEDDDVAAVGVGHILAEEDFPINPEDLINEPHGDAQSHQSPEGFGPAAVVENVQGQGGGAGEQ